MTPKAEDWMLQTLANIEALLTEIRDEITCLPMPESCDAGDLSGKLDKILEAVQGAKDKP